MPTIKFYSILFLIFFFVGHAKAQLNANTIISPQSNYYQKLGQDYPFKLEFSNCEIIWSFQKIFFPSYFDDELEKVMKDNDIKYLNRNQALKLRNEKESDSIYCLKFWFSMDEGYLGFTGTGNVTMDFNEYIKGSRRRRNSEGKNSPFTNRELDYIKSDLDIKTGFLEPVKNYENIQQGKIDVII
jgi:hypothetical protein